MGINLGSIIDMGFAWDISARIELKKRNYGG
jgi:hypothetical protein